MFTKTVPTVYQSSKTVKSSQKQSKDSQNSKDDHWCTNRHMSTKTVPTVYQSSKTVKRQSKQQKNDHWCTNCHMSTQSPPNTPSRCWCIVWIWRYQRHSTTCDDTDSASDGRLLAIYNQFIKDYRGSQVPAHHWWFYEKTGEREVMGYKRLMIVCRRSLLLNSATNDKTVMMATFLQLMQRTINMVMPAWRCRW